MSLTDYVTLGRSGLRVSPAVTRNHAMNDFLREGKSRYYGFSDTPAWYVARAQTLAEKEGKERPIALQLEYSLVERISNAKANAATEK